ncbi:hypothetical protein PIB30_067580 [Stylosanthes scabra]|uniref:Uncharacterized protein n=1 Tax=Stylosanthes scabra TaxID=79078 RepID=A0ABU6QM57_9FABA|nr:hypothetical protein [Stylosanthes scabra]
MNWKNSDVKPTTTPKSTKRRLRSGMIGKSSGEHLNRVKKQATLQVWCRATETQPILWLSSSTVSIFDAHRFRKAHNEQLFDSYARRRKVIPEVGFNLEDDEYPEIMEQIALRG